MAKQKQKSKKGGEMMKIQKRVQKVGWMVLVAGIMMMLAGNLSFAAEKFPSKPITLVVPWGPGGEN